MFSIDFFLLPGSKVVCTKVGDRAKQIGGKIVVIILSKEIWNIIIHVQPHEKAS
jgi:hypothetical protein